ncbi:type II toxin-antitoxin system Phd/YefM family antitoxin [Idiomarina aminovorans]|uniref:type II toxin-antitoxin system Phd/YefM family antitoxin n=1 Tax=Idiomarina aminovorans TaxID=2914829 RepID=UPI00249DCC4B|nr:type II toxin-antitoxin system Phd/YefM family antitoxin [Idiomarina sp. ATCH4]
MQVKFSEDVIPLSDLKINPGKMVGRAQATHRPLLLTSRGRGIAVVQGLMDVREGNTVSLEDAKATLGIP